jgi:hypothetical protein
MPEKFIGTDIGILNEMLRSSKDAIDIENIEKIIKILIKIHSYSPDTFLLRDLFGNIKLLKERIMDSNENDILRIIFNGEKFFDDQLVEHTKLVEHTGGSFQYKYLKYKNKYIQLRGSLKSHAV